MDSNILIEDLAHPAATLMQAALNSMPTGARVRIADACAAGAKLELRMREGSPTLVALWLVNIENPIELCSWTGDVTPQ